MRSRTTFKKRQKELARQEKQRDKVARRLQRKLEKNSPDSPEGGDQSDQLDGDEDLETVPPSADGENQT
ncbi:MAG TPA: hypothetical protein VKR61_15260 [Bryobacteraceae bacterium]|nr:hypothetical protein [Bryobacteraceae bacterium]